jgi:maltose-binding protein MalE
LQDKQQKLYDKIGKVEEVKEKIHQIKKDKKVSSFIDNYESIVPMPIHLLCV